jgi:hypothetical protein
MFNWGWMFDDDKVKRLRLYLDEYIYLLNQQIIEVDNKASAYSDKSVQAVKEVIKDDWNEIMQKSSLLGFFEINSYKYGGKDLSPFLFSDTYTNWKNKLWKEKNRDIRFVDGYMYVNGEKIKIEPTYPGLEISKSDNNILIKAIYNGKEISFTLEESKSYKSQLSSSVDIIAGYYDDKMGYDLQQEARSAGAGLLASQINSKVDEALKKGIGQGVVKNIIGFIPLTGAVVTGIDVFKDYKKNIE